MGYRIIVIEVNFMVIGAQHWMAVGGLLRLQPDSYRMASRLNQQGYTGPRILYHALAKGAVYWPSKGTAPGLSANLRVAGNMGRFSWQTHGEVLALS